MTVGPRDLISNTKETFRVFLDSFAFQTRFKVFLMLAKARKSSFNANIGEFCSVIFVCLFVFYGSLNYLDIFRIQAYAII